MNINHVFAEWERSQHFPRIKQNVEGLRVLLHKRQSTFRGFLQLEEHHGFLKPDIPFKSTQGQEMVRILLLRSIEELMECGHSEEREHFLEEAIDFVNYTWSIPLLNMQIEGSIFECKDLATTFIDGLTESWEPADMDLFASPELYFLERAHPLLEILRNRPWMHNSQSTYFDGWPQVFELCNAALELCCLFFNDDWDEFIRYYVAKDEVLRYRLETKY